MFIDKNKSRVKMFWILDVTLLSSNMISSLQYDD